MTAFGPLASYPLGATPSGVTIHTEALTEAVALASLTLGAAAAQLRTAMTLLDAGTGQPIKVLLDRVATTGTAAPHTNAKRNVTESAMFNDALRIAWTQLLAEGLALTGTAAAQPKRLAALVDGLHASGATTTRLDAQAAVTTALALNTLLNSGWSAEAIDSVAFQDALGGAMRVAAALVEAAGFDDDNSPQMRISALTSDSFEVRSPLGASLEYLASLTDGVLMHATIRLGTAEYAGWVLNQGAASEYRNYPFNGFVKHNGRYYGTSDDGLYLLEGTTDDGAPIASHITTGLMDFGTSALKRIPDVYVAMARGDTVVLKVVTTGRNGITRTDYYTQPLQPSDGLHNGRIKVGAGLESRYWQWRLENVDGAPFELDQLAFRPLVLDRRL